MNENTTNAITKYLLDDKMFSKVFLNKTLINADDHIEFNNILHGLTNAKDINEHNLWASQLKVFCEKKYEEIKVFIPIILDDVQEIRLFLDLFIIINKYHNDPHTHIKIKKHE